MQLLFELQVNEQSPPEQSALQAWLPLHEPWHWPALQLQLPVASHDRGFWAVPDGRGSGRLGAPEQAMTTAKARLIEPMRILGV